MINPLKNMVTFFVAMHHCFKLFAVLQQLFAAKQQINSSFLNNLYISITYEIEKARKNPENP
jgi:hypothetical protein